MLSDSSVRRLVLARFISRVGGEAAFFVGIWGKAAFTLDATPGELAFVMGALGVASLIGASLAGVLIDRFDPRRVLLWGEIFFIPAVLAMVFADTIPLLVAATFLLGLVGAPVFTAISSFAPFLTDDEDELARINGWIEGAAWAAFVIGPAAGAVIAASVGVDGIFVLDAATSAVGAALVFGVKMRPAAKVEEVGSGWKELREGFSFAYGHQRLRFYIWLGSSVWLLFGFFSALEPLFFRDVVGVEVETLGWVNSIFGLGLVGGTWLSARIPGRLRTARTLAALVGLNALGVVAYVGTGRLAVVMTAGAVWGVIIGAMVPLHRTLIQVNTPDPLVGRIMGVNQMHAEVGHLIPLTFAPALAAAFGVQSTMLGSGLVVAAAALLFWPGAKSLDRTREAAVPPPGMPEPEAEPRSVGH
ncbi:MAG: MFS transporter [Actinobacteria bacterium]|nr:MFS transporter [Actinomycetota bacterium]